MYLSVKWLNDYIDTSAYNTAELAEKLTMSGTKAEKYTRLDEKLKNIVIGKVISCERHTGSDKMWVAQIDIGQGKTVQIVTAAQNVYAGAFVPVVLDGGSVVRENKAFPIKTSRLRGVESQGMMCGFEELGMENYDFPYSDRNGILIFNEDPDADKIETGMNACEFIGMRDDVIEFEITNNRPDCLSVIGLAQETAATLNIPFSRPYPLFTGVGGEIKLNVLVENGAKCSRYMAAEVRNVKIAPSPRFITERLRAAGVRSINNLVDITNFVMLEYGHPMHAFDKRYVEGDKITVRDANYGEVITLLDGTTQTLDPETLVIADNEKAIAIAGVMGGEFSGIMEDTKEVVFESACFDGASVRKSAKKIGRRTESSARFEKGLNPVNAEIALFRALELVEQLGCGDVVKKVIDVKNFDESRSVIRHNFVKISDIIGQEIAYKEQTEIFKRLGFEQGNNENGAFLVIPPWRVDISLDCDLAEEVARIYGYNNIRSESILLGTKGFVGKKEAFTEKLRRYAVACGCYECLSFSFSSPNVYEKSGLFGIGGTGTVHIRNPLGDETASMRASMLPSMLDIVARNCKNTKTGRFFEIGRIYVPKSDSRLPEEKSVICIGAYGDNEDFFTIKGLTEEILNGFNVDADFVADRENASYHSGRCAVIKSGSTVLGTAGEIHPAVRGNFDIRPRAYAAEIDADVLFGLTEGYVPKFAPLPKYPAATRDLSLLCGESVTCSEVIGKIKSASRHLESVNLFDVYKGANIPDGKRSLSFGLVFRKNDGTFTDEEIDGFIAKILRGLEKDGITLRS